MATDMATDMATKAALGGGFFCVVEGIDGSGKSTLAAVLGARVGEIQAKKMQVGQLSEARLGGLTPIASFCSYTLLAEPTSLKSGQRIRELLRSGRQQSNSQWLSLFWEDRRRNVARNIKPALRRGAIVIQDRYFYSTAAYQGAPPLDPQEVVEQSLACGFPKPDLLLFLNIDPGAALQRLTRSGNRRESFEAYQQLSRAASNYHQILPEDTVRLDALLAPEELCARALEALEKRMRERIEKDRAKGRAKP